MKSTLALHPYEVLSPDNLWICPSCSHVFEQRPAVDGKVKYASYVVKKILRHMTDKHPDISPNEYRGIEFRYHIHDLDGKPLRRYSGSYRAVYDRKLVELYSIILREVILPRIPEADLTGHFSFLENMVLFPNPLIALSEVLLFTRQASAGNPQGYTSLYSHTKEWPEGREGFYQWWVDKNLPHASRECVYLFDTYRDFLLAFASFRESHISQSVPQDVDILKVKRWKHYLIIRNSTLSDQTLSLSDLASHLIAHLKAHPVSPVYEMKRGES